jgi:hypothetical protein
MAKGWETIRTDRVAALPKADAVKKAKVAAKVTNVKSLSYEDLKKEGIDAHAVNVAREDSILAAAADKKLKSESLKKEATAIQKKRSRKNDKNSKAE